ncbi:DNA repair protein RAD50 [Coccinella septempunctata]|uniref:DNA repair protein RAD50 n=1 Tax=Coccinella septempunctata TaxID=41139 RepID=UPI001D067502|nr:DNA repair protein RAD50 [Coccinella septempunctata]
MATLLKLQLSGIRSFGPFEEHTQTISFDTPVTLLVGQNGCGKTTILEAIKYACTSDLPGGTAKGQGFVHDPKISDRAQTKGQIRLKLIDVKGDIYTIVKAIQVVQGPSSMSFSSLDSSLSILYTNGEKHHSSGRCVEIDKHCAQVLQISPCILNNVLFCHQENSSWPLDEGKKVKEKFDEIFDSKKYNKCGEVLSKALTAKETKIKLLKYEVETKKEKKVEVTKKKKLLDEKKDKCRALHEDVLKKVELLEPHKIRLDEIEQLEVDLGRLQKQLASKDAEKKGLIQQQNMLKQNITDVFQGDDEELQVKISEFEQDQKKKEALIRELDEKRKEIAKKETRINEEIQKEQIKLGQLREEKKQFELKINNRNTLFVKAKESLEVSDPFVWDTTEESLQAINKLKAKLKVIDDDLQDFIKKKNLEESVMQEKIDKAREALATTKEKVKSTSTDIRKIDEKMLQVKNEIQELDIASSRLVAINKKIENLTKTLETLESNFDEKATEVEIGNSKKEIVKMETKLEELEELYKILQHNYIVEEKLNLEEQTKIKKRTELNKIMNRHSGNFNTLFKEAIPKINIGGKVQAILSTNENEIKKLNTDISNKQKEITKLETQIHHQSRDIKRFESELQSKKSQIASVCRNTDYTLLLRQTFERKERFQKEKGQYSSAKIMYQTFIEEFEKEKACCPICETDFSGKTNIVLAIVEKLKQKIISIPEKLATAETNLNKEEKLYNKLQQLKPVNENVEELSNVKLPLLYEQLENDKTQLKESTDQLSKLNEDLKTPTKIVEICRKVLTDATLLDQYYADIKASEENIDELLNQKQTVNTTKNKQEVESELENLNGDLKDQRKKSDSLRQKLDQHKQRCQKIKEDKSRELELQLKYQTQANNKPHLEKQLEELNDNYSCLLVEKEEQQAELTKLDVELNGLNKEKTTLVSSNEKLINNKRLETNKKSKLVEEIVKLDTEITDYRNKNSDGKLQDQIEKVSKFEDQRKKLVEIKNETMNKITEKKEEIAKQATKLRDLQDNVTLREKQKAEGILVIEITKLQNKIGTYNYQSVYEEKLKLKRKIELGERDINSLRGQETELKTTIEDIEKELNQPENKNSEKIYKEKLFELKLMEKLVTDLKIYIKALHHSVLEYHKDRMVQINYRIRELWRNIYKGNDIDYIEIQTKESKSTSSAKKTYDYKVVQKKNGVELEMRGRCSAGQRVLACLIIRIALAESFSSHCGILALDEPTTNLDKENVTSLTYALSNLITSHVNDNNFQLIVITHDQDFLDILRHSVQNISHYWRVSRNPQGYSIIKKERL